MRKRGDRSGPASTPLRCLMAGAVAGAAGTTALNAVTYLDMAVRGRPGSDTPQRSVESLARLARLEVPGSDETRAHRLAGLGPLLGLLAGVSAGGLLGMTRALGLRSGPVVTMGTATTVAMVVGNGPMTALGVTDPRTWSRADWLSDVVPHVGYGIVTGWMLTRLT